MSGQSPKPRWLRVLIALGKSAAYLGLFLGWQIVVSSVYSAGITAEMMLRAPMLDYDLLYQAVYEVLLAKTAEISLLSGLLTLASLTIFFRLRRKQLDQELWLRPVPRRLLGWCAGLSFCLYWLVSLVLSALPATWLEGYSDASAGLEYTGVLPFFALAVVAPITEEVIFRGLIFTRLDRAMSGRLAVVLSAVVFGLCHGQFIWFCYALLLGMVFGGVTRRSGSIFPSMLMHVVFNATNELLLLAGDWYPGAVGWGLIFVVAIGGSIFCAIQVRKALPEVSAEERAPSAQTERTETVDLPSAEPAPGKAERPGEAVWDPDSGPDHRFPPQLR